MEKNPDELEEVQKPELQNLLEKSTTGLLFMSETDAPFEYFAGGKAESGDSAKNFLKKHLNLDDETPVKAVSLEKFFKNAATEQDWHEEEEKATVKKFQELEQTLKEKLTDIEVVRVGETEIDAYILGKTESGEWAGLKTKLVET
jgi:hypothetical protein